MPFFFRYSPWVIKKSNLIALRAKKVFFETFSAKIVKHDGASRIGVVIKWKQSIPDAKSLHLYVLLRRDGYSWKVIGCDF